MRYNTSMADSLFRISLKAYIENDRGEVLVVKERGRDWWDLPGGGMEHDENVTDALARELKEEVGYEGKFEMSIIGYYDPTMLVRNDVAQIKLVFKVEPENFEFYSAEDGDEVAFMSIKDLKKMKFDERIVSLHITEKGW